MIILVTCLIMSRKLDRLRLDEKVLERLHYHNIDTVIQLLTTSPIEIMDHLGYSMTEVKALIDSVSEVMTPTPRTASEILQSNTSAIKSRYLQTGLPELNKLMRGGLPIGLISEIVGPAGIGKTQFCICCAVNMIHGTKNQKKVLYIDTELKLDVKRLVEIATKKFPDKVDTEEKINEFLTSILIGRPETVKELELELNNLQTTVIEENIGLIVIDSIASLIRKENLDNQDKEQFFAKQGNNLNYIAEACQCFVLTTNQVTANYDLEDNISGNINTKMAGEFNATLGMTWHHFLAIRLVMYKDILGNRTDIYSNDNHVYNPSQSSCDSRSSSRSNGSDSMDNDLNLGLGMKGKELTDITSFISLNKSPACKSVCVPFMVCSEGLVTL